MCEKRFRNGQRNNAVGNGTTCHHRSVVDRHRSQHPDQVQKAVHQALYAQTPTPAAPSGHSQGSALIQMNFEAFDLADVKIIDNCRLNKLYFMQYYTALYINAENLNLINNK
jgi:hypothetical protein